MLVLVLSPFAIPIGLLAPLYGPWCAARRLPVRRTVWWLQVRYHAVRFNSTDLMPHYAALVRVFQDLRR